jgi:Protein phosphatase 2C
MPDITQLFQVAGGTVTGTEHVRLGRNRQDAYRVESCPNALVAVVCDGCGGSPFSEVGAHVAARMTARRLLAHLAAAPSRSPAELLERTRLDVLAHLLALAEGMGGPPAEVVHDYLLFTTVGAAIDRDRSFFFSLGDGLIVVNGAVTGIPRFPGNAPPYMAYSLIPGYAEHAHSLHSAEALAFQIHECLPTQELRHFVVGSDGAVDLVAAQGRKLPGRGQLLEPVSRFWEEDFYSNPRKIDRFLRLANEPAAVIDWQGHRRVIENGLLPDDTTLVVGRRRQPLCERAAGFSHMSGDGEGLATGRAGQGLEQEVCDG